MKNIGLIVTALVIVVILGLYMCAFTVRWQEKALVISFGRISREVSEPGLNWKWPWPIQTVTTFDTRVRTYQPQAKQIQTRDKQTLILAPYVNWRITDAQTFYERFRQEGAAGEADVVAYAEKKIMDGWINEALNVVAEYDLGQLITLDEEAFKLAAIEGRDSNDGIKQRIQAKARTGGDPGLEILDVGIRQLGIPDSVSTAVFDRMNKDREAAARTLVSQGKSRADTIAGEAESEATRIMAKAEAEAKKIEGEGDAAAAQYYEVFLDNPELANFLRRLDTLRATLQDRTTLVLDSEAPPYHLLTTGPSIGTTEEPAQEK